MNRLIRILPVFVLLLSAIVIVGCTNDLTAPDSPAFAVDRPETPAVFTPCFAQPYGSAAGWIGPKGGVLKAGSHVLKVPPNALPVRTWITMETPSSTINRVNFGPEGLQFRYPAQLAMSYSNCAVPPGSQQQIVFVNDRLRIVETTPSETDQETQTVYGEIRHFSDYALSTYAVVY